MNTLDILILAQGNELADFKAARELYPLTEAQLLAYDRAHNAAKNSPAYDAQASARALRQELNGGAR
ncbi:hypothetical protein [Variovorax sp. GT1P44]|uniref:hypothetical protein n=1 Tax=Variovorax sp. GT1P44 TaxID=3443742 RepID=UPI003F479180